MNRPKLFFVVTEDRYFLSHRLPMARAAQNEGFDVTAVTNVGDCREDIESHGIRVLPFSMERRSLNPFKALAHIAALARLYARESPDVVHHIGMKPVLYGSLAAWMAEVPYVINAFAGLGYVFTEDDARAKILRPLLIRLFRWLLRRPDSWLLLQNEDDRALLDKYNLTPDGRTEVIRGSGIDIVQYSERPQPAGGDFIFAFSGRMIGIKGLQTLKEAMEILSARAPRVKLWLCGAPDEGNPGSWTREQLEAWQEGAANVMWRGQSVMGDIWPQVHAAVQPSYGGEGVPKSLLEAAASGRAIVATDVPGCRDLVKEGVNGFLVPPRDAAALADAMEKLAGDPAQCAAMGRASRAMVEKSAFTTGAVMMKSAALYQRCI